MHGMFSNLNLTIGRKALRSGARAGNVGWWLLGDDMIESTAWNAAVLCDIPVKKGMGLCNAKRALTVWKEHAKPWTACVFVAIFFIVSFSQSVMYISKYLEGPISTDVILEPVTAQDTPWITICPSPGFNASHVVKFLKGNQAVEDILRMRPPSLKHMLLAQYLTNRNLTLEQVLIQANVFHPLWLYMDTCQAVHRGGEESDGKFSRCFFPKGVAHKQLSLDADKPLEYHTDAGIWETELVSPIPGSIFMCSTLKPTFSMNPEDFSHLYLRFREVGSPQLRNQNISYTPEAYSSTFSVYLTQPWDKPGPHRYYTTYRPVTLFPMRMGQKWFLEFTHEKYSFISNAKGKKCLAEEADVKELENCWTVCFESLYLANESACRYPGFRNYSSHLLKNLPAAPHIPQICQTGKQVDSSNSVLLKSKAQSYMEYCKKTCGLPCVKYRYNWVVTEENAVTAGTQDVNDKLMVLQIMAIDSHAKSVIQELSYDFNQMLGEMGGAWGLFLGLSFSTVLGYVEYIFLAIVNRAM